MKYEADWPLGTWGGCDKYRLPLFLYIQRLYVYIKMKNVLHSIYIKGRAVTHVEGRRWCVCVSVRERRCVCKFVYLLILPVQMSTTY